MKEIPDFEIELSQAMDYIMGSDLAKKAFDEPPFPQYTNVLRSLIQNVDRLADNCHMPEFTNHALPHICSVVRRASEWGVSDGWIKHISAEEAGYLLLAFVIHDIGMLSQDAQDLPQEDRLSNMKGFSDISNWVRRTHVIRLENLVERLMKESDGIANWNRLKTHMLVVIGMAASHQSWAWEENFVSHRESIYALGLSEQRIMALNAVIAVCDLLDEDANRCDTTTLIKYKHGTMENMAHWMRHALTAKVDGVKDHTVTITFRKLLPSEEKHEKIYRALRNHYRLVKLYNPALRCIRAQIDHVVFDPMDGVPKLVDEISKELESTWVHLPEFKNYMVEQLLSTFMPEALNLDHGDKTMRMRLDELGLETIDLRKEIYFLEPETIYFSDERILFEKKTFRNRLKYIKQQVDAAYVDRNIGKVRHLCRIIFRDWKETVSLSEVYWLFVYLIVFQKDAGELYIVKCFYVNGLEEQSLHRENKEKLKAEGPYRPLLDVLFCLQNLRIEPVWYAKYKEHISGTCYEALKCDDATELLLETVVGLLWYYDKEEKVWKEIADDLTKSIPEELKPKLSEYIIKLDRQSKIIYHANEIDLEAMRKASSDPLEKAWIDFWREDWKKQKENIPALSRIGNNDNDYREAIQAYFNLVRRDIRLYEEYEERQSGKQKKIEKEKPSEYLAGENDQKVKIAKVEDFDDANIEKVEDHIEKEETEFDKRECDIGVYRFQRIVSEQRFSVFEEQRDACMEQRFMECLRKPDSSQTDRIALLSLQALRMLNALRYWNLWQYIETIRFQTRMEYMNGVYLNEDGVYCGDKNALKNCCIHYIQGLSREALTKEERKKLVHFIVNNHKGAIDEIVTFIIEKSVPIQWPFAIKLVDVFAPYISEQQMKVLLPWLLRYNQAYKGQYRYIDTNQYDFMKFWFDKMQVFEWEKIKELIDPVFGNQGGMMSNEKMLESFWKYAPWNLCIHYLKMLKTFPNNIRKSLQIYNSVIALSHREDKKKEQLHTFVTEVLDELDNDIKQKNFEAASKEQMLSMKNNYEELQELIEVENLTQLAPVDLQMIQNVLDEMRKRINEQGSLKNYDSSLINPVREAFINKNWKVDDLEWEKQIVDCIFNVIKDYNKSMFDWYYRDFCDLLVAMENTGSKELCEYINQLAIKNFVRGEVHGEKDQPVKDGPYQAFCFHVNTKNQYYIAVLYLLASGVTTIQRADMPEVIEYTITALQTDEPVLFHYAMVIFSYFYLNESDQESALWAKEGLQFIAGRLQAERKYIAEEKEDSIYEYVKCAIQTMKESTKWFGKNGFEKKLEKHSSYKRIFTIFTTKETKQIL